MIYLNIYRFNLWCLTAYPNYWYSIYNDMRRKMENHILILNFECEDITGFYDVVAELEKRGDMYVAHYPDFENIVTICPNRRDLDYWIPAMLRTMLAEETGIVPFVRFKYSKLHEKKNKA